MDDRTLEDAFLRFGTRLAALAKRRMDPILLRRLSPEDVVQETMAAARRDASAFASNDELPLYFRLRTILLQTLAALERRHLGAKMRDAYRENPDSAFRRSGESRTAVMEAVADTAASPLSRVARQDRDDLVRRAMALLGDGDRAILELRHEEMLGNRECADLLGISEKAASLRYVRALAKVRDILEGYSEFSA